MASLFESFEPAIQAPFQQGLYGTAWGAAFGVVKDWEMALMKYGVMAKLPNFAPLDALGEIDQERGIIQGPTEPTVSFIARLLNAWGAWTIGGTYWGLLAELNGAGYTTAYIIAANGFVYGPSSGVTPPDPINGVAGTPPVFMQIGPYYATGGAATSQEWAGTTVYPLNAFVVPTARPGTWFIATQGGTSGGSEPSWPGPGGSVTDGSVTWVYGGTYAPAPVFPPWTFDLANGQGDPATISPGTFGSPGPIGGDANWDGSFWSRFVVMFDPIPTSWNSVQNPPTQTSAPSISEIALISQIINDWKPAKSSCVGILGIEPFTINQTWGWPQTPTTNITFACWLSRAIQTGDAATSTALSAQRPTAVYSWLPNTAVANAGGSTYIFTIPSSAYLQTNLFDRFLYSSPASSGTTGLTEPAWPTSIGGTVTDNGITWTCVAELYDFNPSAPTVASTIFAIED